MTRYVRSLFAHGCVCLAAMTFAAGPAIAQGRDALVNALGNTNPEPLAPGGPAPRMADGKPDFSGVWYTGLIGRPSAWSRAAQQQIKEDPIPFKPEVQATVKARASGVAGQLSNALVLCLPMGVPAMFVDNPQPFQLVTIPGQFIQLREDNRDWRLVHTNKRPHPEFPDPLYNGNSSAWWEGDTLIIDSIGFNDATTVLRGWPHSDELHIVERIRRPSRNYLEYQFTAEDPKMLTKPWTSSWRQFTLSQTEDELLENYCVNNESLQHLEKLAK